MEMSRSTICNSEQIINAQLHEHNTELNRLCRRCRWQCKYYGNDVGCNVAGDSIFKTDKKKSN